MSITFEQTRPGFAKYHLNRHGEEPWPWRPTFHVLTEPDPHLTHHEHMSLPMTVQIVRGEGYVEDIAGVGHVTRRLGDRFRIDYEHRIVRLLGPEVWTLVEYEHKPPEHP